MVSVFVHHGGKTSWLNCRTTEPIMWSANVPSVMVRSSFYQILVIARSQWKRLEPCRNSLHHHHYHFILLTRCCIFADISRHFFFNCHSSTFLLYRLLYSVPLQCVITGGSSTWISAFVVILMFLIKTSFWIAQTWLFPNWGWSQGLYKL